MNEVRVIEGSRELPAGFAHAHACEQARRIAEQGLILRVKVGSGVHGTAISGQDDRDELRDLSRDRLRPSAQRRGH